MVGGGVVHLRKFKAFELTLFVNYQVNLYIYIMQKVSLSTLVSIWRNPNIRIHKVYGPKPDTKEFLRARNNNSKVWIVKFSGR